MRNGYFPSVRNIGGFYSDSSGNYTDYSHSAVTSYENVSSGAIIHGNHRDPNPWSYSITKWSAAIGKTNYFSVASDNSWWYRQNQEGGFSAYSDGTLVDSCLYDANEKAISRLYDAVRGNLDLSVDAFQARQTARMFTATENLRFFCNSIPILRRIGSLWLTYQYGWKPLLSTIYNVADESIRWHANKISNFKVSATSKLQSTDDITYTSSNGAHPATINVKAFCRVQYCCNFRNADGFDLNRWTSLNPVSIAWELLPYSFVVDWLIDIGGYLRNAESALLYSDRFVNGYKSVTWGYDDDFSFQKATSDTFEDRKVEKYDFAKSKYTVRNFSRTILSSTPFPQPPRFNVKLGSERSFSAASLLSQFLGKR